MTIRELVVDFCISKGMAKDDAETVVQTLVQALSPLTPPEWWEMPEWKIDSTTRNLLETHLCVRAVAWIDENRPDAWYRSSFCTD